MTAFQNLKGKVTLKPNCEVFIPLRHWFDKLMILHLLAAYSVYISIIQK